MLGSRGFRVGAVMTRTLGFGAYSRILTSGL